MASLTTNNGEQPDRFWLNRLTNYYKKYNPDKIASLPNVLVKYKGNEHKLFSAIIKKYGPEPSVMDNFNEGDLSEGEEGLEQGDNNDVNNNNGDDEVKGEEENEELQKMPAGTISNVEGTPDDWPCTVPLCPVNRLPAEYCEYAKKFDVSKPWLMENYPDLYLQKFDKTVAELCGEEEGKPKASDDDLKKGVEEMAIDPNDPRAAKKAAKRERKAEAERKKALKKKVVDKAPRVVVTMKRRNKRKFTVNIYGLDKFGVKLKDAAKKFSKKFACSSTVTKNDMGEKEISMQGDFSQDLGNIIVTMFPAITIDRIFFTTKKGTIAASSIKVGQKIV